MNREIKFRAWDNENKYMITSKQGIFTALRNSMNITVQDNGYYNNGDLLKPNKEKYTLMQYTGLKDKNGAEIYEGDILRDYSEEIEDWVVSYSDGEFVGVFDNIVCDLFELTDLEVAGNIYENEVD
jgi:uncharacterized phage protein (TIGR01671 family)